MAEYGLNINTEKIKAMRINDEDDMKSEVPKKQIDQVNKQGAC